MEFKDFKMSPEFLIALFTVILATICILNGSMMFSTLLMCFLNAKSS